jgi:hypothetical protein
MRDVFRGGTIMYDRLSKPENRTAVPFVQRAKRIVVALTHAQRECDVLAG